MMNELGPLYTIAELIAKSVSGDLSDNEAKALLKWVEASEANLSLYNDLTSEEKLSEELAILASFKPSDEWQSIANKTIQSTIPIQKHWNYGRKFWLSSAAIFLMVCLGAFQIWKYQNTNTDTIKYSVSSKDDIAPGGNKATLKLSDGTVIILNDSINGFQSLQQNVKLLVQNGEITYQTIGKQDELLYNTITTPNGGQFKLVLNDGTKIWLNAASSLKYPLAFSGNERIIELTGEGYFEVAHNANKPFKVLLPGIGQVDAIGTAFNINAYSEEQFLKTTLLQGKVKVAFGNKTDYLNPGQQAQFFQNGNMQVIDQVELDQVVAWKNGEFIFKQMNVEDIMRLISRWYEIEVIYHGVVSKETFSGIVNRNSSLMEVLKIMEEGGIRFKIDGKKINVF
jgi:ferric-dicitrate binding protein FerR (iron transport regulator)